MHKLPFELKEEKIIFKQRGRIRNLQRRTAEELLNFGIINLDKPAGPKSIHCVNKIRNILETHRAGHAGTLDPMVTGVLPIGIGKAVKVLSVLTTAGKIYEGKMHLHDDVTKEQIEDAFKKFTGEIEQLPPRISAVKRVLRKRKIYWLVLKKLDGKDAWFEVGCEAGTYIRKLCHDIGEYLKIGAHMSELRRIQSGPLKIEDSVTLQFVRSNYKRYIKTRSDVHIKKFILPPEKCVQHLPKVYIDSEVIARVCHGSPIFAPGIIAYSDNINKNDTVVIFDLDSNLIGLGVAEMSSEEIQKAEKGLAIKTDVVVI